MNYQEARLYLDELSKYGSVLGLESMRELLKRLGDPQRDLKFIHIAGTNGKGSVLAYLSTVLTQAGYRTGRGRGRPARPRRAEPGFPAPSGCPARASAHSTTGARAGNPEAPAPIPETARPSARAGRT